MRKERLDNYRSKQPDEVYYPTLEWHESEINILTMNDPISSKRELELLYQEADEYDFLKGKTPKIFPDFWEEED
jgi:hypothetical protein